MGQSFAPALRRGIGDLQIFQPAAGRLRRARKTKRYDSLRGYRYLEIDLFAKDALKKILYVSIYNTTGLNGGDETQDSAPKSLIQKLDPKKIAKQYPALLVVDQPSSLLDGGLVHRQGRRRAQF